MFDDFANVWTPAVRASQIGRKPLKVIIAGEPIVLFRDGGGGIAALSDRCPHRGASLSLGRVNPSGALECPFHGWCLDAQGNTTHVPLNPTAKLSRLKAIALPVREIADLVWVFTSSEEKLPVSPILPEGLHAAGLARTYVERRWKSHWTRVMENMLDTPHVPFVHGQSMGRTLRRNMTPQSQMQIDWEETEWGGRAITTLDGQTRGAQLEFYRPNVMALHIPMPRKHLRIHALVIPEARGRTRLIVVGSRDFAMASILNWWFARMMARIADEDRAIVESAGPTEVPAPGVEPSVETDRATLQFRNYYYRVLRGSVA